MNRKSLVVLALIVLAIIALAAGGGSWLWHLFLRMHGIHQ